MVLRRLFPNPLGELLLLIWTTRMARRILWPMTLSARNRLEGEVVEIEFGGVMTHVVIRAGKNLIESVITKRSAEEMKRRWATKSPP